MDTLFLVLGMRLLACQLTGFDNEDLLEDVLDVELLDTWADTTKVSCSIVLERRLDSKFLQRLH